MVPDTFNCKPDVHELPDGSFIRAQLEGSTNCHQCGVEKPEIRGKELLCQLGPHVERLTGSYRQLIIMGPRLVCGACGAGGNALFLPCELLSMEQMGLIAQKVEAGDGVQANTA